MMVPIQCLIMRNAVRFVNQIEPDWANWFHVEEQPSYSYYYDGSTSRPQTRSVWLCCNAVHQIGDYLGSEQPSYSHLI